VARLSRLIRGLSKSSRIAVLGTTVEYLDLVYQLGFRNVVCIDKSPAFRKAVTSLRWSPEYESLVVGDWLEVLPRHLREFDLILSDLTLGNIDYGQQREFAQRMAESLTYDGRVIDRILTYRSPSPSYQSLFAYFVKRPTNLVEANTFNARWLFCGERVRECELVDTSATYDWTAEAFSHPAIHQLLKQCTELSPRDVVWHYGRAWGRVSQEYFRGLRQVSEFPEPRSSVYRDWVFTSVAERA
jgi:hypothetical protein